MSNLTPLLTLSQTAEKTIAWIMTRLMSSGFQVEQTFDLHAARISQVDCPCPKHGKSDCTCQMVVLLVRGQEIQPGTIVVHGRDGETRISLLDLAVQSIDEKIIQALLPVMENSDV